jgi:hypothetical protein
MNLAQEELPFVDWHKEVPTEEEIRESLIGAKSELPMGESYDPKYATPEQFVFQFSGALKDYLERTMGTEKSHIEDLGGHASAFAKAFACTISWF